MLTTDREITDGQGQREKWEAVQGKEIWYEPENESERKLKF